MCQLAIDYRHLKVAELLLNEGADPHQADAAQRCVQDAIKDAVIRLLTEQNAFPHSLECYLEFVIGEFRVLQRIAESFSGDRSLRNPTVFGSTPNHTWAPWR